MNLWEILLLAVLQGISEFLPISSSGHLAVANGFLEALSGKNFPDFLSLSIVLHGGTLLSVMVFYRRRLFRLAGQDRHALGHLFIGTLPAMIVGLSVYSIDFLHDQLSSSFLAGSLLPLTGILLLWGTRHQQDDGKKEFTEMTYRQALLIGLAQAIAILPGISRSGSTIVVGMMVGLKRESAATFSFLLAIPTIGGAVFLDLLKLLKTPPSSEELFQLALGAGVSFLVGLVALWWVLQWLTGGKLQYFAWWCISLGMAVTTWQLLR